MYIMLVLYFRIDNMYAINLCNRNLFCLPLKIYDVKVSVHYIEQTPIIIYGLCFVNIFVIRICQSKMRVDERFICYKNELLNTSNYTEHKLFNQFVLI